MEIINKNKIFVTKNKKTLIIDKVNPPKFFIGEFELTEYDLRNLQLEVCKGNINHNDINNFEIKDENGLIIIFREDGCLSNQPKGYDVLSRITLDMLKYKRNNDVKLASKNKK